MMKNTLVAAVAIVAFFASSQAMAVVNLALGGTASQSSTGFGGVASRAIDGNRNGTYNAGSVTHTLTGPQPVFWEVDLGSDSHIEEYPWFSIAPIAAVAASIRSVSRYLMMA